MIATAPERLTRRNDPATSLAAAEDHVHSGRHVTQKEEVLQRVRALPGLTSAEIARVMRVSRYIPGRRLPDLAREGLVVRGPVRECEAHGGPAVTWWPAPNGAGQYEIPFPGGGS